MGTVRFDRGRLAGAHSEPPETVVVVHLILAGRSLFTIADDSCSDSVSIVLHSMRCLFGTTQSNPAKYTSWSTFGDS